MFKNVYKSIYEDNDYNFPLVIIHTKYDNKSHVTYIIVYDILENIVFL